MDGRAYMDAVKAYADIVYRTALSATKTPQDAEDVTQTVFMKLLEAKDSFADEQHLKDNIKTEDVAAACYCSRSTLEKLFRYVNHMSIREYLMRRRLTRAARDIMREPDTGILEIALRYGYGTNESFTRAFRKFWNCKPSEFRGKTRFSELFPRLTGSLGEGDATMAERKHVDISELYDLFRERREIPLTLHVGVTRFEGKRLGYDELLHQLDSAITVAAKKTTVWKSDMTKRIYGIKS